MLYRGFESFLSENAYKYSQIWIACVALICLPVVVWHQISRGMLQFELCQDIPNPPHNLDKVHHTHMKGHSDTNLAEKHQWWITIWKERYKYVNRPTNSRKDWTYESLHESVSSKFKNLPNIVCNLCKHCCHISFSSKHGNWTTSSTTKSTSRCQHA